MTHWLTHDGSTTPPTRQLPILKQAAASAKWARESSKRIRTGGAKAIAIRALAINAVAAVVHTDPGPAPEPASQALRSSSASVSAPPRGGGESFYCRGDHRATMPALWRTLTSTEPSTRP